MTETVKVRRWISIKEAAALAGEPIWTTRRWLDRINSQYGGRLLDKGKGGKWLVDLKLLEEAVFVERERRKGMNIREEVEEALRRTVENAEHIDLLDRRTGAHTERIRGSERKIRKLSDQATARDKTIAKLNQALELIGVVAKDLATNGTEGAVS